MSGYTPGPWRAFRSGRSKRALLRTVEVEGRFSLEIRGLHRFEIEANARLIAVAPEQNESLRELLVAADVANELLQHLFPAVNVEEHNQIAAALVALTVARSKARHVIAKAEGSEETAWLAQVDADPLYGQTEYKGARVNNAGGPNGEAYR